MKAGLWEKVVERDAYFLWGRSGTHLPFAAWLRRQRVICMATYLEPDHPKPCNDVQEVDHVKDAPRMGKRAPDDLAHLVAACQNHNTWYPPSRRLRYMQRMYLQRQWDRIDEVLEA